MASQQPRQTLLICLLGGRPQPAALTAFVLDAAVVVAMPSASVPARATELCRIVHARNAAVNAVEGPAIDPLSPSAARAAIESAAAAYPHLQPIVSLTGAPMPMVIGGYQAAQALACPAYYLDTRGGRLLDLAGAGSGQAVDIALGLDDLLVSYGLDVPPTAPLSAARELLPAHEHAAAALARNVELSRALLDWLGNAGDLYKPVQRHWRLGRAHWDLLLELEGCALMTVAPSQMPLTGVSVKLQIPDAPHRSLLAGGWLEVWILSQLRGIRAEGRAIVDDAARGVRIVARGAEREIDCLAVRRGVPIIASIKAGSRRPWQKAYIDELVAVGKLLGDNYCTLLFVASWPLPSQADRARAAAFSEHASRGRVVVYTGADVPDAATWLRREVLQPTISGN